MLLAMRRVSTPPQAHQLQDGLSQRVPAPPPPRGSGKGHATNILGRLVDLSPRYFHLIILAVLISGALVFIWASRSKEWLPWVATGAAGFGATFCAAAGMMPPQVRGRWLMNIAGGIFAALVTWYTAFDQNNQITNWHDRFEAIKIRHDLLQNDLKHYVEALPSDNAAEILKKASVILVNRFAEGAKSAIDAKRAFRPEDFYSAQDVISFMSVLDRSNGHALYYAGEIARKTGDPDNGHQQFFRYLETESTLGAAARIGGTTIDACRTPSGYCRQRTAWIDHLLANDIYKDTLRKKKAAESVVNGAPFSAHQFDGNFRKAMGYACAALKLFEGEFRDSQQLTPTLDLVAALKAELSGEDCP
jgi:hypothetical protein